VKRHRIWTLGAILLVALFALSGCLEPETPQLEQGEPQRQTISTTGSGRVSAAPDVAVVTLGVQTQAEEASVALSDNNERMQSLIDTLAEAGVAEEDIQTRSIRLWPRYENAAPEEQPEVAAYTASNTVEVRVRDLDGLGELLDSAVMAGGNRTQGVGFEVSDPTLVLLDARQAAWTDAQQKAAHLAELAGVLLGEVVSMTETSQTPGPVVQEGIGGAAGAVPVQPGSQTLEVTVQVTWELLSAEE
jgi:uncharacterized protein YggE